MPEGWASLPHPSFSRLCAGRAARVRTHRRVSKAPGRPHRGWVGAWARELRDHVRSEPPTASGAVPSVDHLCAEEHRADASGSVSAMRQAFIASPSTSQF